MGRRKQIDAVIEIAGIVRTTDRFVVVALPDGRIEPLRRDLARFAPGCVWVPPWLAARINAKAKPPAAAQVCNVAVLVTALVMLALTGCSGWVYNGVRGDELRHFTARDGIQLAAGVAATYAVHLAGHVLVYEMLDENWHLCGFTEVIDGDLSHREQAVVGHAGFFLQIAVGYGLRWAGWNTLFTRGYALGTVAEVALYPVVTPLVSDYSDIDDTGYVAWAVYSAAAAGLLWRRGGGAGAAP
jgi:hypothetical protein